MTETDSRTPDPLTPEPALPSDPDRPDPGHEPPAEVDEDTVVAVGKVTAALEVADHARGMLYAFHRLIGRAEPRPPAAAALGSGRRALGKGDS